MQPKLFSETFNFPGREISEGVELFLKVTPRASKNRMGNVLDDGQGKFRLCVYVTAMPEDNKANIAVIDFLADFFKVSKSSCKITSGEHARQKTLLIYKQNIENIMAYLL